MLERHGDEGEHAPSGEVSLLRSRKHAARRKTRLTIGGSPDGLEEREKEKDDRTRVLLVTSAVTVTSCRVRMYKYLCVT